MITQVGGPVSRILATPGQHVENAQPLLYVASPDYSLLRSAYIKARDLLPACGQILQARSGLYEHKAIAEADVEQAESTRTQAEADLQASEQAIRILGISDPETLVRDPSSPGGALLGADGGRNRRAIVLAGAAPTGGNDAVFHAFRYELGVGARQHLPERRGECARRRRRDDQ